MKNSITYDPLTSITLIGFDVRRSPKSIESQFMDLERRSKCLLQPQSPMILSADRSIWPSIFFNENEYEYIENKFPDDILNPELEGNEYFQAFNLWDEASTMRTVYRETATGDCGIALGLVKPEHYKDNFISDSWFEAIYSEPGILPEAGSDWPFLGFDIVNSGFESAVSGFILQDKEAIREKWDTSINEFSLFDSRDQSLLFCQYANTEMATDGPFYMLALFLLWDTTGEFKNKTKSLYQV